MLTPFQLALKRVLEHEGLYSHDPRDPGGETYKGISRRAHPNWPGWKIIDQLKSDTPAGTLQHNLGAIEGQLQPLVEDLYRKHYWEPLFCDRSSAAMGFQVFDAAVNHGEKVARRLLQLSNGSPYRFNAEHLKFYTSLPNFKTFGRGWTNRIIKNLEYASIDTGHG